MGDQPTIANILAQIAISGTISGGAPTAPREEIVRALVDLGLSQDEVTATLDRAIQLGLVDRRTGERLAIAS